MPQSLFRKFALFLALTLAVSGSAFAQPAPQPAPGGPANIFYGATPPNALAPVIVFVHGLGSNAYFWFTGGNDMYTQAYNAGWRTVFISMNADNSQNSASIATNAATLQGLLPTIQAHVRATKLFFVCHSKGGEDTQAAMQSSSFLSSVRAVFTLASPNTGTPLADWAYGPGMKIAQGLGLLTPGLFDLQTANMATLRAQWDPVLAAAHIPFFFMEGTKYIGTGNPVLDITGPILKSLDPSEKNDGLVPVSYVTLPSSYALNMGSLPVNHIQMGIGSNTWPSISSAFLTVGP